MKRTIPVAASLMIMAIAVSVSGQNPRPTPTPAPRPATPTPAPAARPATPAPQAPVSNAPVPEAKVAVVDTSMFNDDKTGIRRYVNAVKSVEREFQPKTAELNNLQARVKTLADEIARLRGAQVVDPSTIKSKQDEGERLQREYEYKKQQYTADFEKRLGETTVPVSNEIMKALNQYAASRGITLTLDFTRLAPAILTMVPALDITQAFIADYNSKNP